MVTASDRHHAKGTLTLYEGFLNHRGSPSHHWLTHAKSWSSICEKTLVLRAKYEWRTQQLGFFQFLDCCGIFPISWMIKKHIFAEHII